MNTTEQLIISILQEMSDNDQYIALQLHPPHGHTTIEKQGNRMLINEGRKGKFKDISEQFYDECVAKYDSRCKDK
jgi:hypothetical protein